MECSSSGPFAAIIGFFSFLGDPIGTILKAIAEAVLIAAISIFGAVLRGIPTLTNTEASKDISSETQWIVVYLAVGSILFASARMALERRGEAGVTALKGILRVILVSGAATFVVGGAVAVTDDYTGYLLDAGARALLTDVGRCSQPGDGINSFLLLILAFLLLVSAIIHTILLWIRLGVMILLLGTLPVAAAASMTDWGGGWWRKHIGWMIAWLLYKPAAGLVMYAGSRLIGGSSEGPPSADERIAGIGVMLLSAVALPALLKLIVPATAALGGASAMSGAMSSVGGGVASGARSLGSRSLGVGGGSGGAAGASGPRGASGAPGGDGSSGSGGKAGPTGAGAASRPGASGAGAQGGGASGAGAAAASGAGARAAAAGGPAGAAIGAAVTAAQIVGRTASGSLDGADGDLGHNR